MSPRPPDPPIHFAIVLAAGASTRMGTCKASLPWLNGTTLLSYQVEQLLQAGVTPIVVLAPHNQQQPGARSSQIAINPHPEAGKVSSIHTGLRYVPPTWHSLMVVAVDQPRPYWIYQSLLQAHNSGTAPITAPTYQGRIGHPLVFSAIVRSLLEGLQEETLGLRQVIRAFNQQIQRVEFHTPDVLLDLNTPEQYHAALLAWQRTSLAPPTS